MKIHLDSKIYQNWAYYQSAHLYCWLSIYLSFYLSISIWLSIYLSRRPTQAWAHAGFVKASRGRRGGRRERKVHAHTPHAQYVLTACTRPP